MLYTVLEILMIARLGGTPGQPLCGMYVKDLNTFKSVTLMQATIRCISETVFIILFSFLINYVSRWLAILTILISILAIFNKCKQFLYDKIARIAVTDYKSS
ncbi:RDD family protein [Wolbachia endosymbiont of Mansonella perstans]|uniref:RDD family protein n=1 Tax=Wolbachia endosymbiont of Mansonella perstans TaxID=229526 RepID=UPI001CE1601C|nr:RDD family protein [Wolbachia endosymbiont of Mansonella perstans]